MITTSALLTVRQLSKRFGRIEALREVSFDLLRGEFCILLGPNGAGKSTLFQILTGLFRADHGEVLLDGQTQRQLGPQYLARLGVVFQQPTLDLDLSVRSNLRYHARLHGLGREAAVRIDEVLDRFDLLEQDRRKARELSGGNRRRLELARALLHRPELLLMDEASIGLDPLARRDLLRDVRRLCDEAQCCVLWATHLSDEAEAAQRVLLLHRGALLASGELAEVTRKFDCEDIASLYAQLQSRESIS